MMQQCSSLGNCVTVVNTSFANTITYIYYFINAPTVTILFISRFMYSEKCDIDGETVLQLLYLAKKYCVSSLEEKCSTFLRLSVDGENVSAILDHAIVLDQKRLEKHCLEVVTHETKNVFNSKGFLSLSKAGLTTLLTLDKMNICSEADVYNACKIWASEVVVKQGLDRPNDENIRLALSDVLPLIRFPTMTAETFSSVVAKEEILNDTEKVQVFRDILSKESVSPFSKVKRVKPVLVDNERRRRSPTLRSKLKRTASLERLQKANDHFPFNVRFN